MATITSLSIESLLLTSSVGRQLIESAEAEVAAETLARRQEMARERKQLITRAESELPKLRAAADAAAAKLVAARAALKAAETEVNRALSISLAASARHTHSLARIDRDLQTSAPTAVAEALSRLQVLSDETHFVLSFGSTHEHYFDGPTQRGVRAVFYSNVRGVERRLEAIRSARATLLELQLLPLTTQEVVKRIASIMDALPPVADARVRLRPDERARGEGRSGSLGA